MLICHACGVAGDGSGKEMRFEAVECSSYDDKRLPPIHELKQTAWILRTTLSAPIGFVSPQEWRNKWCKEDEDND